MEQFEHRNEKTCLRGFATRHTSNRPAQLQRLARVLKFWPWQVEVLYYPGSENKGTAQTGRMRRLTYAFVVRIWYKQVFSWRGSFYFRVFMSSWLTAFCCLRSCLYKNWNLYYNETRRTVLGSSQITLTSSVSEIVTFLTVNRIWFIMFQILIRSP